MRVLLTGANGFVGGHVMKELVRRGHTVMGVAGPENLGGGLISLDLRDAGLVGGVVGQFRPNSILHLAAQSSVGRSWDAPEDTFQVNVIGTINLWQAARKQGVEHFIYASTAEVYQQGDRESHLREDSAIRPTNPYGLSKCTAEQILDQLRVASAGSIRLTILRPFNHTGPGQGSKFVVPAFAHQLAAIHRGAEPIIRVGNLDVFRDFLDVRDVTTAYCRVIALSTISGTYNICSGVPRTIQSILEDLSAVAAVGPITLVQDPERMRPTDKGWLVGDPKHFYAATNWSPAIAWEDTLRAVWHEALDER